MAEEGQTQAAGATPQMTGDLKSDLATLNAALQAQQGQATEQPGTGVGEAEEQTPSLPPQTDGTAAPEAAQVQQPQQDGAGAEQPQDGAIPEKFQKEDGSPDQAKIHASTMAALAKYRAAEIALKKKQDELRAVATRGANHPQHAQPQPQQPQQPQVPMTFEEQIENDLKTEGAGKVLSKLFAAAEQSALAKMRDQNSAIQQEWELGRRDRELTELATEYPDLFTEGMAEKLAKIREDKPWINASPLPWTEAFNLHLAEVERSKRRGAQVQKPIPKGPTAPIAPAGPVPRAPQSRTPSLAELPKSKQVEAMGKMNPKQLQEELKKHGIRIGH